MPRRGERREAALVKSASTPADPPTPPIMKLKSITIKNFKAFGKTAQKIPIKPITLVFGPNSGGKSSIIHSLLLLNHAEELGKTDVHHPVPAGKSVDLGGFDACLNRNSRLHQIQLGLTIETPEEGADAVGALAKVQEYKLAFACGRISQGQPPEVVAWRLATGTDELLTGWKDESESLGRGHKCVLDFNWSHPALRTASTALGLKASALERQAGRVTAVCQNFLPTNPVYQAPATIELGFLIDGLNLEQSGNPADDGTNSLDDSEERDEELFQSWKKADCFVASEIVPAVGEILARFSRVATEMAYLPPLREVPDRWVDLRACDLPGWRLLTGQPKICERANQALQSLKIEHRICVRTLVPSVVAEERIYGVLARSEVGDYVEILSSAARDATYVWAEDYKWNDFKEWLDAHPEFFDKMAAHWRETIIDNPADFQEYYFETHPESEEDMAPDWWINEEADRLAESLLDDWNRQGQGSLFFNEAMRIFIAEDPKVREAIGAALKEKGLEEDLLPGDGHQQLRLHDPRRNVWVALQDVGVGTSQCLPIILEAYGQHGKLILIEQPELHLHPALQAELGDVFVESALGENENTFLLETHSEHLILRILRRIRETTEGEIADWPEALRKACPNGIRPDDVAVLYVEPGEDGARVIELPVDANGEFTCEWPGGFFEERMRELF